jgi:hypothetical protein
MGNLDYIEQLGMGEPKADETTELTSETNTTEETDSVTPQDMLTDSEERTSEPQTDTTDSVDENTVSPELLDLKKQIEGMEKRLADKDTYIDELREASKLREESKQKDTLDNNTDTDNEGVEEDFWDDPVAYVNKMKEEFARQSHVQQMQINETIYANTVEDYWGTVNQDNLLKAIKADDSFAEKFNSSKEPYKLAYEYLTEKKTASAKSEEALREQIRKEVLAEIGKSPSEKKKTVPSTTNMGGNSGDGKSNAPEDGFMAVFNTN